MCELFIFTLDKGVIFVSRCDAELIDMLTNNPEKISPQITWQSKKSHGIPCHGTVG